MNTQKFTITDNTTYTGKDALDFYSTALLEGVSTSSFRLVSGVETKIKLPLYDAGNVIQDAGCSWSPSGEGTLDQKSFEVCAKNIQLELCTTTFENNFLGELLKPGSNTGEVSPAVFTDYMLNEVALKVSNDLEVATWKGDSATSSYPMSICDGILKIAAADVNVVDATPAGTITLANVIAEITKVYNLIPNTIINKDDVKIYVSDYIARLYVQAIAAASNEAYYVGKKELNFLGIELFAAPGMADGSMVAGSSSNFVFLTDLQSDEEGINVIPQYPISGVRSVRIVGAFKFGVGYLVSEEVVLYAGAIA